MFQKTMSAILLLAAVLAIGVGTTGFYTLTSSDQICFGDEDCAFGVCCDLADKPYGVCAQEDKCSAIFYDGVELRNEIKLLTAEQYEEQVSQNYIAVGLGVILLIIIALVSYVEWQQNDSHKKKTRRRKKKKAKK